MRNTIAHPVCFDKNSGRTSVNYNNVSIEQSLRLLLLSSRGELIGDPFFGTNLMMYINEPNDIVLEDMIINDFLYAINRYEKRISVSENDIHISGTDAKVNIEIGYYIVQLGTYKTFELSVLRGDK